MRSDRSRVLFVPALAPAAAALQIALALHLFGCATTGAPAPVAPQVPTSATSDPTDSAASSRALGGADCAQTTGYDAVIVGAGLAGLAAGKELVHLGRSVLILEATDRVGGRGFVGEVTAGASAGTGDERVPIDYGGAWIHGVPTNPLTGLIDAMGFTRVRSELDVPFYLDGRLVTDEEWELFGEAWEAYEAALGEAAFRIGAEKSLADELCEVGEQVGEGMLAAAEACSRLAEAVADEEASGRLCAHAGEVEKGRLAAGAFCSAVEETVLVTSDVAARYLPQDVGLAEMVPLVEATAGPLESAAELGASSAYDAAGFEAGEDDLVAEGLGTFVERYGDGLPVCLGSPVTRIEYGETGVRVHAAGRSYEAATAVVTVSVGVLRAGKIDFEPKLPAWKREAIEGLRMGHMQKVILPFRDDVFGDATANSWVLAEGPVTPAERALAERAGMGVAAAERRVMAFVVKPLGANVAIGFYGGEWAELFEAQCSGKETTSGPRSASGCDDPAIDAAVRMLEGMVGTATVRESFLADEVHVTRWSLEPYTLGAYSVPFPGAWHLREVLARPVAPGGSAEEGPARLFFAGEAASRTIYNGSYAGAWETGLAAAREIHAGLLAAAGSGDD